MVLALLAALTLTASADAPSVTPAINVPDINDDAVAAILKSAQAQAKDGNRTITLRIDSFGGGVFAGLDLIDGLEQLQRTGVEFTCIVDSRAMSMAAILLESDACDHRLATPRSIILFHNGSMSADGKLDELLEAADLVRSINETLGEVVAQRLGWTPLRYAAKIRNRAWTLTAREAVSAGALDGLVNPAEVPPLATAEKDQGLLEFLLGTDK